MAEAEVELEWSRRCRRSIERCFVQILRLTIVLVLVGSNSLTILDWNIVVDWTQFRN